MENNIYFLCLLFTSSWFLKPRGLVSWFSEVGAQNLPPPPPPGGYVVMPSFWAWLSKREGRLCIQTMRAATCKACRLLFPRRHFARGARHWSSLARKCIETKLVEIRAGYESQICICGFTLSYRRLNSKYIPSGKVLCWSKPQVCLGFFMREKVEWDSCIMPSFSDTKRLRMLVVKKFGQYIIMENVLRPNSRMPRPRALLLIIRDVWIVKIVVPDDYFVFDNIPHFTISDLYRYNRPTQ